MEKPCQHIDPAIDIALLAGNKIYSRDNIRNEYGNYIIFMYDPLTSEVKKQIGAQCGDLEYWAWKGSPHNPSTEGYTCNQCSTVLVFPETKTPRLQR